MTEIIPSGLNPPPAEVEEVAYTDGRNFLRINGKVAVEFSLHGKSPMQTLVTLFKKLLG
jgi:hypothetical protein